MRPIGWLTAALLLHASPVWAQPAPEQDPASGEADSVAPEEAPAEDDAPGAEVAPRLSRNSLHDLTADVLPPGQGQFNVFWLQYSRGILPGLQLSSQLGADLITLVNLTGEYQFLRLPELRASIELGGYWLALSPLLKATIAQIRAVPRATVPLPAGFELTLAAEVRALIVGAPGVNLNTRDLRGELSLVREDDVGAWFVQARFPIATQQTATLAELLGKTNVSGSLVLDDLSSWSITVARDFAGDAAHFRIGVGYRNTPGIVFVDSIGPLIFSADFYWR